jgi:hypothetical protein
MRVTVIDCTDLEFNKKNEHLIGQERDLTVCEVAILYYVDGSKKMRITSKVDKVVIYGNEVTVHTKNTIYSFKLAE